MVKWTTISSLIGTDIQTLAVEQPTLQWQKNIYNNGSLFFYPDVSPDADYLDFQQKTFFACFNQERPSMVSSNALSVSWDGCSGKLDLNLLEDAFFLEFKQMWESSLLFQDQLRGSNQLNLRYFLAGVGAALGHVSIAEPDNVTTFRSFMEEQAYLRRLSHQDMAMSRQLIHAVLHPSCLVQHNI